jgi:hypothetical protein
MNARFLADSHLDAQGIRRWNSNDQVPPTDCLKEMGITGPELARMEAVRDQELDAFLAEYRANQKEPTSEELCEMRAAFGPGARVVNVFTGRVTTT